MAPDVLHSPGTGLLGVAIQRLELASMYVTGGEPAVAMSFGAAAAVVALG